MSTPAIHTNGLAKTLGTLTAVDRSWSVGESTQANADRFTRPPLPYPNGWAFIAYSDELRPGAVLTRQLMGGDIVVYRTRSGAVRVIRPYCPHLGAHLGKGGQVDGEDIVCPFHGFAYGPDGACIRTAYNTEPPPAALSVLESAEVNGLIFAWHHHEGTPPSWRIPELSHEEFSPMRHRTVTMTSHPQEFVENIVDIGHFPNVHGLNHRSITPLAYDRPLLTTAFELSWRLFRLHHTTVTVHVEGYGLGCLIADVTAPEWGVTVRTSFALAATGPWRLRFGLATSVSIARRRLLPAPLRNTAARMMCATIFPLIQYDVRRDLLILNDKEYVSQPRLAKGDGEFTRYRRWATQFYPENTAR